MNLNHRRGVTNAPTSRVEIQTLRKVRKYNFKKAWNLEPKQGIGIPRGHHGTLWLVMGRPRGFRGPRHRPPWGAIVYRGSLGILEERFTLTTLRLLCPPPRGIRRKSTGTRIYECDCCYPYFVRVRAPSVQQ